MATTADAHSVQPLGGRSDSLMRGEGIAEIAARRIKEERIAMGFSIEKLAERAGIGTTFLAYIERGRRTPSLQTIGKLATALEISQEDLFKGKAQAKKVPRNPNLIYRLIVAIQGTSPKQWARLLRTLQAFSKPLYVALHGADKTSQSSREMQRIGEFMLRKVIKSPLKP